MPKEFISIIEYPEKKCSSLFLGLLLSFVCETDLCFLELRMNFALLCQLTHFHNGKYCTSMSVRVEGGK